MSATIEIKYFNSFWLKKMESVANVASTVNPPLTNAVSAIGSNTLSFLNATAFGLGVGQELVINNLYTNYIYNISIVGANTIITLETPLTAAVPSGTAVSFKAITSFAHVPAAYSSNPNRDWFIEEARITGGYNNTITDLGVKAFITDENFNQQHKTNSLIYSGIFNSRTGINNTNQFPIGSDITRSLDPSNGSIQFLFAEDTNLTIFQESKVSKALIDKDAIYTADGQSMTTSGANVIGQIQSYAGNYGISTNPESFAAYGYRKYFTDKNQNAVLRLSQDGITELSGYGMNSFFRDNLALVGNNRIVGGWDIHNKQYVASLQFNDNYAAEASTASNYQTLIFDENTNGWTSRFDYAPDSSVSLRNKYYTFKNGYIWSHYSTNVNKSNFYGKQYNSNVTFVFNDNPSLVKNFNTISYEGSPYWKITSIVTDQNEAYAIAPNTNVTTLASLNQQVFANNFKQKENKYFANIMNKANVYQGQNSRSGVKGFYNTVTAEMNNAIYFTTSSTKAELFAVSVNYVESSY